LYLFNEASTERNVVERTVVDCVHSLVFVCAGIEDLCTKRDELQHEITDEEEEKRKIQNDIRQLTDKLAKLNESLSRKVAARNEFDRTIAETEAAYTKVCKQNYILPSHESMRSLIILLLVSSYLHDAILKQAFYSIIIIITEYYYTRSIDTIQYLYNTKYIIKIINKVIITNKNITQFNQMNIDSQRLCPNVRLHVLEHSHHN